jgi:hypothetical protein
MTRALPHRTKRKASVDQYSPSSRGGSRLRQSRDPEAPNYPTAPSASRKSNRLTLKGSRPSQQSGGKHAASNKSSVKLGNYDVSRPDTRFQQDSLVDRSYQNDKGRERAFGATDQSAWWIDTNGCEDNLKYGSNSKWEVPIYRITAGQGSVLGLDPAIKLDRLQSSSAGFVLMYPAKVARARFEAVDDENTEVAEDGEIEVGGDAQGAGHSAGGDVEMDDAKDNDAGPAEQEIEHIRFSEAKEGEYDLCLRYRSR